MHETEEKLRQQIYHLREESEKRKWMRTKKTFLVLSGVVYLAAFMFREMNCVLDYLSWIVYAPIFAGLYMYISSLVLLHINRGSLEDEKTIARLQGKLDAIQSMRKDV